MIQKLALAVTLSITCGWGATKSIDIQSNRDSLWNATQGDKPAHWLTKEDSLKREIYRKSARSKQRYSTPQNPRSIAEFEPMEAVIISYSNQFGFEMNLIEELSRDITVYILASTNNMSRVKTLLNQANVTMKNIEIVESNIDSYWSRDYGPWSIAEGKDKISVVDFHYNRPRPNDDNVPTLIANKLGISSYLMDLEQCGGNYMSNGLGEAISTDLVIDENGDKSEDQVRSLMREYLGIDTYHITEDPLGDYIKHVDCWGKYLAPDKILIGEVTGAKKEAYDSVANYFETLNSPYGTPYKVYRVYTEGEPYTNSTIVNNKIFVPIQGTSNDEPALAVYREAMPGYTIIGIRNEGRNSWMSTDALHCRTKGVADRDMVAIEHTPKSDTISLESGDTLQFSITPYSKKGVNLDSTYLFVRRGLEESFHKQPLTKVDAHTYQAVLTSSSYSGIIPTEYYLEAVDSAGERAQFPIMGKDEING